MVCQYLDREASGKSLGKVSCDTARPAAVALLLQYFGTSHADALAGETPGSYRMMSWIAPSIPKIQRMARPVVPSAQYLAGAEQPEEARSKHAIGKLEKKRLKKKAGGQVYWAAVPEATQVASRWDRAAFHGCYVDLL